MNNTITLKQIGYRVTGEALLNLWGGGQGTIEMSAGEVIGPITKEKLLACINDGRFGCESIESVHFWIYDLYENGYTEMNRDIIYDNQRIHKYAKLGI